MDQIAMWIKEAMAFLHAAMPWSENAAVWIAIGFLGQALFSGRFLVQWLVSEIRKESVVPIAFWFFSLAGGVTLLTYAIWQQDIVIISGQLFGLLVYGRNLMLIRKKSNRDTEAAE
jgi:lipid-A-disaccharide synthase-like uncharacterized protein